MLPDLPVFVPKQVYVLSGKFLWLLCRRVQLQTPLRGRGLQFEETKQGIVLRTTVQANVAASLSLSSYDFKASWSGTNIAIASGNVISPNWGTVDQDNPAPTDWTEIYTISATTLAIADGQSVWAKITWTKTDLALDGPLSLTGSTSHIVYGGAGGAGGDGGGGGGGGASGGTGGTGGAGANATATAPGGVGLNASGGNSPGSGSGTAADGGDGGDGGAGGAGESKSFTHYTRMLANLRRWSRYTAELVVSTNKPAAYSHTETYVRLASVSGGVITQHHAGQIIITPSMVDFITP